MAGPAVGCGAYLAWVGHRFGSVTLPFRAQQIATLRGRTESPVSVPAPPSMSRGVIRWVTMTRASMALRAVTTVAQSPCSRPRCAASSGDTSTNSSG